MAKRLLQRHMPTRAKLQQSRSFRFLDRWLHKADIWHFNRRYACRGILIGMFFAFIPLPTQMIMACVGCIFARGNLPISIACVWLTNPLTMGPVFYGCYRLGAFLMNEKIAAASEIQSDWLANNFHTIVEPLFLGSLICAVFFSAISYTLVDILWRWHTVKKWHNRAAKRNK